jgi:hypothetical protein
MNEINDIQMNEVLEDDTAPNEAPESEEATEALPEPELNDQETISTLKEELERLRLELSNTRAVHERLSKECEEFSELYPSVPMTTLPDSIWKSFKEGVPLAAAYALYEKKEAVAREKASSVNEKNRRLSSGSLYSKNNNDYFSPAEVRAMSAAEVKANYAKIITSMSKWH